MFGYISDYLFLLKLKIKYRFNKNYIEYPDLNKIKKESELKKRRSKMSNDTMHAKDWIKNGIFVVIIAALATWGALKPTISESDLEKATRITNVVSENVTYGYLTAHKADLIPSNVCEIVECIGVSLEDAISAVNEEKIKLTEVKTYLSAKINEYIDKNMGGNVAYKILADSIVSGAINSAEAYLNSSKSEANDFVVILNSIKDGIEAGKNSAGF